MTCFHPVGCVPFEHFFSHRGAWIQNKRKQHKIPINSLNLEVNGKEPCDAVNIHRRHSDKKGPACQSQFAFTFLLLVSDSTSLTPPEHNVVKSFQNFFASNAHRYRTTITILTPYGKDLSELLMTRHCMLWCQVLNFDKITFIVLFRCYPKNERYDEYFSFDTIEFVSVCNIYIYISEILNILSKTFSD